MRYSPGVTISWERCGVEVRRRRLAAGLTQEGLARAAGTTANTVAMVERGERRPSVAMLERVAAALRCHVTDLLKGRRTRR